MLPDQAGCSYNSQQFVARFRSRNCRMKFPLLLLVFLTAWIALLVNIWILHRQDHDLRNELTRMATRTQRILIKPVEPNVIRHFANIRSRVELIESVEHRIADAIDNVFAKNTVLEFNGDSSVSVTRVPVVFRASQSKDRCIFKVSISGNRRVALLAQFAENREVATSHIETVELPGGISIVELRIDKECVPVAIMKLDSSSTISRVSSTVVNIAINNDPPIFFRQPVNVQPNVFETRRSLIQQAHGQPGEELPILLGRTLHECRQQPFHDSSTETGRSSRRMNNPNAPNRRSRLKFYPCVFLSICLVLYNIWLLNSVRATKSQLDAVEQLFGQKMALQEESLSIHSEISRLRGDNNAFEQSIRSKIANHDLESTGDFLGPNGPSVLIVGHDKEFWVYSKRSQTDEMVFGVERYQDPGQKVNGDGINRLEATPLAVYSEKFVVDIVPKKWNRIGMKQSYFVGDNKEIPVTATGKSGKTMIVGSVPAMNLIDGSKPREVFFLNTPMTNSSGIWFEHLANTFTTNRFWISPESPNELAYFVISLTCREKAKDE